MSSALRGRTRTDLWLEINNILVLLRFKRNARRRVFCREHLATWSSDLTAEIFLRFQLRRNDGRTLLQPLELVPSDLRLLFDLDREVHHYLTGTEAVEFQDTKGGHPVSDRPPADPDDGRSIRLGRQSDERLQQQYHLLGPEFTAIAAQRKFPRSGGFRSEPGRKFQVWIVFFRF